MTIPQKILVASALTVAIGAGSYEAYNNIELRDQIQILQQQQSPLVGQIEQLQQERDAATSRLAAVHAESELLKSNQNTTEILKLRDEVARLKFAEAQKENDPAESVSKSLLNRVRQLKKYVEEHPNEVIPEFQFLTDREWLLLAAPGRSETDLEDALQGLKSQAAGRFAELVEAILQKYSDANNGQFPSDLSQLQPYCDPNVEAILQQRYEIKPASILLPSTIKDRDIKTDRVIAGKDTVASNTADHIVIFAGGYAYYW